MKQNILIWKYKFEQAVTNKWRSEINDIYLSIGYIVNIVIL